MTVKRWSLVTLMREHRKVALDANVLIYLTGAIESHAQRAATAVIDVIGPSGLDASMATVGLTEVLAGPARTGDAAAFERTAAELRGLDLRLIPLTADVAEDAAWLRRPVGLSLADAVHVASARAAGATAFVTNDRRIGPRPGLAVYYLDDLDPDEPVT